MSPAYPKSNKLELSERERDYNFLMSLYKSSSKCNKKFKILEFEVAILAFMSTHPWICNLYAERPSKGQIYFFVDSCYTA